MKKMLKFLSVFLLTSTLMYAQPSIQWQKSIGGTSWDDSRSMIINSNGEYVITGQTYSNDGDITGIHSTNSDIWVARCNSNGVVIDGKCLGGSGTEAPGNIQQTMDGGYILVGTTYSNDGDVSNNHSSLDTGDVWVVKLDSALNIEWQKCYGGSSFENGYYIEQTPDSGYIISGSTISNDGDVSGLHPGSTGFEDDGWVLKIDVAGDLQWQKCFGGSKMEQFLKIRRTTDGGYLVGSFTYGSSDGDLVGNTDIFGPNPQSIWMVKMDSIGTVQWSRTYGGSSFDNFSNFEFTPDGGLIMIGASNSTDGDVTGLHLSGSAFNQQDIWIVKLDTAGLIQWQKCYGSSANETAYSIGISNDGGYIIGGLTQYGTVANGDISALIGEGDIWIFKINSTGTLQWEKTYGGTLQEGPTTILSKNDGSIVFYASTYSNNVDVSGHHGSTSTSDMWLVNLAPFSTGINQYEVSASSMSVFPNPANNSATISFELTNASNVSISIVDVLGREIAIKNNEILSAGKHQYVWDCNTTAGQAVSEGIYFVRVKAGYTSSIASLIITR
ncbi:MAG: T9SS type A sorting domain-containing protein [Bacteroidetes bacterium]|nr:T9SS type A sorting domain-containing protein [Bacteroidota bacterium]